MIYEKPTVEIVAMNEEDIITASGTHYSSWSDAIKDNYNGYDSAQSHGPNNFVCNHFGGITNPEKNVSKVVIGNNEYVFEYKGGGNGAHWKCSVNNH